MTQLTKNIHILLTKRESPRESPRESRTISARGLDSTDRAHRKIPRADILSVRSRASLVNKRFITRLQLFRRKTQMIDCKDTINFKCAIFIWSKLNVYSRLTFPKRRKTKLEENKNNILCGVNTKKRSKTTRKSSCGIIRDSAGSNT